MSNVVPFGERLKDVTYWPLHEVRDWCRRNGWVHGFKINWAYSGEDRCVIERLSR